MDRSRVAEKRWDDEGESGEERGKRIHRSEVEVAEWSERKGQRGRDTNCDAKEGGKGKRISAGVS
jgi:hypothetical protein